MNGGWRGSDGRRIRRRLEQTTIGGLLLGRGRAPVPIGPLVSPLRYDVVVRAGFFSFLARNMQLYEEDLPTFVSQVEQLPYHEWFQNVVLARAGRENLQFQTRVVKAAQLYLAYRDHGFEARHPITLQRASSIGQTSSGLTVERPYYPKDGCHRLALLITDGARELTTDQYRVVENPRLQPLDNTYTMLRHVPVDDTDYVGFLSFGYTGAVHHERDALVADVRANAPERLAELEAVMAKHDSAASEGRRHVGPAEARP